jgi:hypothetical protein
MPDWEVPLPIRGPPVVETAGPRAHPVEISDDEVEVVKEVEAPVQEEPAQKTHEKPPSAEVPLERVGALERALERVEATRREGAIPSLPGADTQPAEVPGVQEGSQRVCCGKAGGLGFGLHFRLPQHCGHLRCLSRNRGSVALITGAAAVPRPWPVGERDSGARSHGELAPKGSLPLARHMGGERGLFLQHNSPPDP